MWLSASVRFGYAARLRMDTVDNGYHQAGSSAGGLHPNGFGLCEHARYGMIPR